MTGLDRFLCAGESPTEIPGTVSWVTEIVSSCLWFCMRGKRNINDLSGIFWNPRESLRESNTGSALSGPASMPSAVVVCCRLRCTDMVYRPDRSGAGVPGRGGSVAADSSAGLICPADPDRTAPRCRAGPGRAVWRGARPLLTPAGGISRPRPRPRLTADRPLHRRSRSRDGCWSRSEVDVEVDFLES